MYVLERHLKKFEIIHPKTPDAVVGQIRNEPIYRRSQVQLLHTSEKWFSQEGRIVRPLEQPVKYVKSRVVPSKRAIKDLSTVNEQGDDPEDIGMSADGMVGLYGRWQTEPYVPDPIVNGIIPKNKVCFLS
jgi:xeroderma pigmentosum group C-complementing protein